MRPTRIWTTAIAIALLSSSCTATTMTSTDSAVEATPVMLPSTESAASETAPPAEPTASVAPTSPTQAVTPTAAIEPVDTATPEQFDHPVLALLATISPPADGKGFSGQAINYQQMFAEADIDPTSLCGQKAAYRDALVEASLGQMTAASAFFNPYSDESFYDIDEIERAFGFSFCDINATVVARLPTIAVHANVDPTEAIAAAEADERWSDLLEVSEEANLTVLDWSQDLMAGLGRSTSSMFPYVFPITLGIAGDVLVRTSDLETLHEAVDPTTPSLLETGSLRATVEAIIAEGSHQFHFTNLPYRHNAIVWLPPQEVFDDDGLSEAAQAALARSQLGLPLWTSLAVGITRDADQQIGLVVMSHLNEADAAESAARFEAMVGSGADHDGNPWNARYQVRATRTEGQLMIAELDITDQTYPLGSLAHPFFTGGILYALGDDPATE